MILRGWVGNFQPVSFAAEVFRFSLLVQIVSLSARTTLIAQRYDISRHHGTSSSANGVGLTHGGAADGFSSLQWWCDLFELV